MAIDFSQVKEVKYNSQDVTKIQSGSTVLWQKVVDPTANLIEFSSPVYCSHSASSGAINIKGVVIPEDGTQYKVYWRLNNDEYDSNYILSFPFKKGSSSSAADSKFGIGTSRADSSNKISSGSSQYGLTLTDQFDLSSFHTGSDTYVHGEFTITPGTSSSFPNKCLSLIQLESLYSKSGGRMITPYSVSIVKWNYSTEMYINNEKITIPSNSNKVINAELVINANDTTYYYNFYLAIEKVS